MDIGVIGGIIILALLIVAVIFGLKKSSDTKAVSKFLNSLGEKIYDIIIQTIKDADPSLYHDVEAFENAILTNVYDAVWDYVAATAESSLEVDNITKTIFKMIDKDAVIKFIDEILNDKNLYASIRDTYASYNIENNDITKEDDELAEEYSDQSKYVETSDNDDLAPAEEPVHTEEETAALNPQRDEDEEYNVEDDSMELVTEEPVIVTSTDKNGNTLYYEVSADGKKTRVSKAYALEKGKL